MSLVQVPSPRFVYHLTPVENLPSIKREGLRVSQNPELLDEPGVYLFPSQDAYEDAGWLGDRFDDDGELALLTIDGRGLTLYQDPDVGYEMVSLTPIPPNAIKNIETGY